MPDLTTQVKEPTVLVQLRAPISLVADLRKNAEANDRTLSAELRRAAREYLGKHAGEES